MINCKKSTVHNRNWVNNDRTEDFTSDQWKGEGEKAKKDILRRKVGEELRSPLQYGEKAFGKHEPSWAARKGTNSRDFRR